MSRPLLSLLGLLALAGAAPLSAAEPAAADARLRESLRSALLQVRNLEAERAALQSTQSAADQQIKLLTAQVDTLTRHGVEDRAASDQAIAALKARLDGQAAELAQTREELGQTKLALTQAVEAGRASEARRGRLEADLLVLQRLLEDREAKNLALFKVGSEILTRYEKFSLGEALRAREPFVGLTRVKLETLVQDYQDKLSDQRIK